MATYWIGSGSYHDGEYGEGDFVTEFSIHYTNGDGLSEAEAARLDMPTYATMREAKLALWEAAAAAPGLVRWQEFVPNAIYRGYATWTPDRGLHPKSEDLGSVHYA